MITDDNGDRLRLVTQPDHALLAADLLALWRRGGVAEHRWRDEILWATREHDNGWQEADAAPLVRARGSIHDYRSVPTRLRQEIWLRSCSRFVSERPVASSLIVEHGRHLHRDRRQDAEWTDFLTTLDEMRDTLREEHPEIDDLLPAYQHLERADGLSLALCEDAETRSLPGGYSLQRLEATDPSVRKFRLEPFPFAGATRFRVAARRLTDREWSSTVELVSKLARTTWDYIELQLQP